MKKFIQATFNIEGNETKPVILAFLMAFLWGASQIFNYTAANTIFLVRYGASYLAYSFIFNAVLLPITGLAILKLSERISFSKYIVGTIVFFCVALLSFRVLLSFSGFKWPAMVYLLWIDIEYTLETVLFMNIMNKLFHIRQTKRLYGLCYLGAELAYIVTGLVINVFVKYVGALNLIQFALGFDAASILVYLWIYRSFPDKMKGKPKQTSQDHDADADEKISIASLFNERIILGIFGFSALYASAIGFINTAYMEQAQSYLGDEAKIASFLALLYSISSIFIVIIKGLATSRFLKTFGVTASLMASPIMIGVTALLFVVGSSFSLSPLTVFGLAVLVKLMQTILGCTIYDLAYFNVLQSLPAQKKDKVISLSETVVANICSGIAGVVVLVMMRKFQATARELFIVMELIIIAWAAISLFLGSEYRKNLKSMLNNRVIGERELSLTDKSVIMALMNGLQSTFAKEVIYSIEMLDKSHHPDLNKLIREHAGHEDMQVRMKVAEVYQTQGIREDRGFLLACLEREQNPHVISQWLKAIANSSEGDDVEVIEPYLKHPDMTIVMGAITALIRYCGIEGTLIAGSELKRLCESPRNDERRIAAEIIGMIGLPNLFRFLKPLLLDSDIGARKKAIAAAGALQHPRLIPLLFQNLDNHELRPLVMQNIISYAENGFPELENIYRQQPDSRRLIAYLYGRIKGEAAIANLRARLSETDRDVLGEILHSLELCGYIPTQADIPLLDRLLKDAAEYGARLLFACRDICHCEQAAIVTEALRNEIIKNKERVFCLVGFLIPGCDIRDIRFNYFLSNSEEKRAMAVELLDSVLTRPHKKMILPLLEDAVPESSMNALSHLFPDQLLGQMERIKQMRRDQGLWRNSWLRATALHALFELSGGTGAKGVADELRQGVSEEERSLVLPSPAFQGKMSIVEIVSIMKKADIFSEVPAEVLAQSASRIKMQVIPADITMFRRGDAGSTLYIIAEGRVKVHLDHQHIAEFKQGDIFGELSALHPEPRTADVTTLTPVTLLSISNKIIYQMIDDEIIIAKGIIKILCQRFGRFLAQGKRTPPEPQLQAQPPPATNESRAPEFTRLSKIEKLFVFKTFNIFSNIPDGILHNLAALSKDIRLMPGETLFRKGDAGTSMYLLVHGEVKVYDEDRVITVLRDRTVIGELAALSSETRTASITAIKETQLLRVTQGALDEIMWDRREAAKEFIRFLTVRIQSLTN